jgi:hypothetical protein
MFWRRLFRREAPDADAPLLNISQVVAEGQTSPDAARHALDLLTREDDRVQRRIKAILSSHGAMTPGKVRRAIRASASTGTPGLTDSFQRQLAEAAANTSQHDARIEALENHRKSLCPARNQLRSYLSRY